MNPIGSEAKSRTSGRDPRRRIVSTALNAGYLLAGVFAFSVFQQVWALNKVTNYAFTGNSTGWTVVNNGTGIDGCGLTSATTQNAFATFAYNTNAFRAVSGTANNTRYKGYLHQQVTIPGTGSTDVQGKFYYTATSTNWRGSNPDGFIRIDLYNSANTTLVANLACEQLPGANVTGTTVVGTATAVTPGTYTLRVTIAYRNSGATTATINVDNVMVNSAPTGLAGSAVGGTTNASLSWTASSTASGPNLRGTNPYQVYRGTTSGGETALAFAPANSYTDATTTGNTTYYYQLSDFDLGVDGTGNNADDNESPLSSEVSVLTCPGAPGTPTFSGVTASNITVSWTAPTGGSPTYTVERAPDVAGAPGTWAQVQTGVAATSWSDTTVACATTYWYRVRGTNASGNGAYSGQASQATSACPATTTVGDGTNPANDSRCPGGSAVMLDAFTLQTSAGNDTITAVQVAFAAGTSAGIGLVEITNDAGGTVYGSFTNPADTQNVTLTTNISATTALTQYKVRITPRSAANMPVPPGGSYAVTGTVTAITSGNAKSYADSASATVTVDNLSPATSTFTACTPSSPSQIDLTWTNPGSDFAGVIVVRGPAGGTCPTFAPTEGTAYATGAQGSDTIVFVGAGTSFSDTALASGTAYCYEVWSYDACGNHVAVPHSTSCTTPAVTTTVGNGTNPANDSRCPGGTAVMLDAFTLQTSSGTDTVTAVQVAFAAGTSAGIGLVEITNDAGGTVYGSFTNPADTQNVALTTNISASTTLTQYKVRITPRSAANMPVPPGGSYAVTGTVSAITSTNTRSYADASSATVTVDNLSPSASTFTACTPAGSNQINLTWTNPGSDFSSVIVVRGPAGGTCPTFAPTEGMAYATGAQGSDTIVYAGSGTAASSTGLAGATTYCFEVWSVDSCGNWVAAPDSTSCTTGAAPVNGVSPGVPSFTVDSCTQVTVSAPWTNDANLNSSTAVRRGPTAGGPFTVVTGCGALTGASPRACVDTTVSENSTYYYEVDFTDADGVVGTDPQVIGPVGTPACATGTTVVSNSASAGSCRQINVVARFSGDGDLDGTTRVEWSPAGAGTWTTSCASLSGASPRSCLVVGLGPGASYDIRVTHTDPDGVSGTNPQTIAGIAVAACGADQAAPTLTMLSPARDAIVGGTDRFKVQVHEPGTSVAALDYSVDGGAWTSFLAGANANYNCGTACGVYEFNLNTTALANGSHTLSLRARDAQAPTANEAILSWSFRVANVGGAAKGAGTLLRRSHGSQLCVDCHNLATHSSQHAGTTYGNWSVDCLGCHTPHRTRNVELVAESVRTPNSGTKTVNFRVDDRSGGTNPQNSYLGAFDGAGAPFDDGICEVCHTRTNHYRNDNSGGDHSHNQGVRCVSCHKHEKGFGGAACDGCHKAPPVVGKHGAHDQVGTLPTAYGATTSYATATQYGFPCGKCHVGAHVNDTHAGSAGDPYRVEVGFDATTDPKNPAATYAQVYPGTADPGNDTTKYWSWTSSVAGTDGRCSNLYCHSNAAPLSGTNAYATPQWNQAAALTCASCHSTSAKGDTAIATDLSAAHGRHIQSTSGETGGYTIQCDECHAATVRDNPANPWLLAAADLADKTRHVNGAHDVAFSSTSSTGGFNQSGASYAQGPSYTCSNTYCHSNGQDRVAPFTSGPSLAWGATAAADCSSCHGGNASAAVKMGPSNDHAAHMDQASYLGTNFACGRCHAATLSTANDRAIVTHANHVNGTADLSFSNGGTYSGSATKTCSNVYCHSNGTETPDYVNTNLDWDAGFSKANDCLQCHGVNPGGSFTSVWGEPNYASNTASDDTRNSHARHVSSTLATAKTQCVDCHAATLDATGALKAAGTHLNQAVEITTGGKIGSYTAAGETCTNISCHGGNSAQWGGASLGCINCHGGASDVDNWNISDGTISIISTNEWGYSGHGKAAGTYDVTGNTAANFGAGGANPCLYCHDDTVTHQVATNPFRLRSSATTNQVCLNCHATGSAGVQPAGYTLINGVSKINSYHYGAKHGVGANSGQFCWDCHEPHGDRSSAPAGNISMVRANVTTLSDGVYGLPSTQAAVVFTARSTGSDFAKTAGPFNGICNVCHTTAQHYRNASGDGHFGGSGCTASCHLHNQSIATNAFLNKSLCNECHNAPPPATAGRHAMHDGTGTVPTSYTNLTADTTATAYGYACAKCHAGTHFSDSTHAGTAGSPYQVQVAFDTTTAPANTGGAYAQLYPDGVDPGADPVQNYSWTNDLTPSATGRCTNLYCHSNAAPVNGTDSRATVYWNQATGSVPCTGCHATQARGDSGVLTDLSAAHGKHIQSTSGETGSYAYLCDECHAGIIRNAPNNPWALAAADIVDKRNHVTGTHSVTFSTTLLATAINQSGGTYAQAPTYTCASTYCHSGGVATAAPFSATASAALAWTGTANCRSCHGWDAAAAPTIGVAAGSSFQGSAKHANHVANATVIGTNYLCADCHNGVVSAGNSPVTTPASHVNGVKNVAIATRGGWTSSDTTATCSATYCHSTGQRGGANVKKTVSWTDAAWAGSICIKCHGSTAGATFGAPDYANGGADTATANSHGKHVDAATDCAVCHRNTTTTGTSILAGAVHTNGVITLVFDTAVAGATVSATSGSYTAPSTYVSATCTNVLCHGTNAAPVKWGATNVFCPDCHGGATDVNNWNITDGTASKIATGAEWTTYGHGSAAVNLAQGKTGIDLCRYCHDWNVNHKVATNPFRLLGATGASGAITAGNFNAATNNGNAVCWNCHGTGSNGVDPDGSGATAYLLKNGAKKIDSFHQGADHASFSTNGGARCWDCHDPHGDATNLAMVGSDTLRQSSDAYGLVGTRSTTAAVLTTQGAGGYANTTTRNGICQVCHTNTSYWRSASEPTAHNVGTDCTAACHAHDQTAINGAFAGRGGGTDCWGCHSGGQGSTRAISGDFGLQSHHVRTNVGAFGGATKAAGWGTNEDCVVCHAEGQIVTAASADCTTGTFPMPCTNPTYHANGRIDLRDVDVAAPVADGTGTTFPYDSNAVAASAGAAANWGSGNQVWREWTSGVDEAGGATLPANAGLDKFCLNCHDSGGAAQISTFRLSTETSRTATDPFWDGATNITNTYDQVSRGAVTDIKSRVTSGATSLDKAGEPRYDQVPAGDTIADPPQGIYSRHAIRGQSLSVYSTATQNIPNARWVQTSFAWKDSSVMGCADCHTVDGANGTSGNAHGSGSEYLLKDASGTAAEGTYAAGTYNCFRCHAVGNYDESHTAGNASDFSDTTGQVGAARVGSKASGSIYGIACTNCHGGGYETAGDTTPQFGTIHGTSQILAVGGGTTRQAYRFMNGNSLRFFNPGTSWTASSYTCYTLSTADSFGSCTQHSGGKGVSRGLIRNLKY